jgi:hypothetical protein
MTDEKPETKQVLADIWKRVREEHDREEAERERERHAQYEATLARLAETPPYIELYHQVDGSYGFYVGEYGVERIDDIDNEVVVTLDNGRQVHVEWENIRTHHKLD